MLIGQDNKFILGIKFKVTLRLLSFNVLNTNTQNQNKINFTNKKVIHIAIILLETFKITSITLAQAFTQTRS